MTLSRSSSFEEHLEVVAATVPEALVPPAAAASMAAVARVLPAALAQNTFGFECRLGEELARADLSVQATAAHGRDLLAGTSPTSSIPVELSSEPSWRRVRDLGTAWADSGSVLNRAVENVWLEFDLPVVDGLPRPSVFLGLALDDRPRSGSVEPGPWPLDARVATNRTTAETMARLLLGHELPARVRHNLGVCLAALGEHEYVFQVGLMLARGTEAVRLCLRLGSPGRTLEYLAQVGWPGTPDDLKEALGLAALVDYTWLDLDVGHDVSPKIGLECYFERHRQPSSEPRWRPFLGALVRAGLCTVDEQEGLLAYPGQVRELRGAPWPAALRDAARLLDGHRTSAFVRTLHHVKIVCRPAGALEAKAYLAATYHWRTA